MDPLDAVPPHLQVRLQREMPVKSQQGCTATLALILFVGAALAFIASREPGKNSWVPVVVGILFALFGLLLLWAWIRQLAASGIPETLVECSAEPLQPGGRSQICLIQPGPAKLKSLCANLVCIEETLVPLPHANPGRSDHRRDQRILTSDKLIDTSHLIVPSGDTWQECRELIIPEDARVTETVGNVSVFWKVEVWGKGQGLASFMHPFRVEVFRGQRSPLPEDEEESGEK